MERSIKPPTKLYFYVPSTKKIEPTGPMLSISRYIGWKLNVGHISLKKANNKSNGGRQEEIMPANLVGPKQSQEYLFERRPNKWFFLDMGLI